MSESHVFPSISVEAASLAQKGAIKIGPFGSQLRKEDMVSDGIKVYGQENVISGDWSLGERRVSRSKYLSLSSCELKAGDIVLTMMGTIGRCGTFPEEAEPGIMDSHLLRIQVDPERVDGSYLATVLGSKRFVGRQVERQSHGSIMAGLSSAIVRRLTFPLPPLPEQQLIASILDTVDEVIRKTEEVIAKLQQMKQGLLHDLLTRGIDDNGELRDPDRHPEQFKDSPLGRIPKDWEFEALGHVSQKVTDGTHQAVTTVSSSGDDTVPFLYVSCVKNGRVYWDDAARISQSTFNEISRGREPRRGMILYTAVGSYGHAAAVDVDTPFAFQRHLACIYPDERRIASGLLAEWLNSARIRSHADRVALGNAQKTVTLGQLSRFPIILPSPREQIELVRQAKGVETRIAAEQAELAKLRLLKSGLMDDLLTGRVRVTDLLP